MRTFHLLAAALLAASPAAAQQVVRDVGFQGSEAARYDEARDEYLVSNLGAQRGPDGGADGFVSRVAPDGTIVELKWISQGLVDPLGIFVHGDRLYVADVAAVKTFDRSTGAPRETIDVAGAVRLNDLAVAPDGTVYVTDSGSNESPGALWRIGPDGAVSAFAPRDPGLERPNGIAVLPDGNVIHGGRGVNLVVRTPAGAIVREVTLPTGQFDGIVVLPDGSLLVASQLGHNVYRLDLESGSTTTVAENIEVPAAIGYDPRRNRLLVPQIRAATLTIHPL
ncbi:SMP-30/gluconolactonase/LRE family protein [Sphingosinicella sp. CPCC 101087]|uniref:SMP-30/gluconolactonase/LRE family protein n=1 Tax=Sphingosinicella sp. CPCC 101087 TaxID=2497754 RepID=UPI00101DEB4B|nr:SMP-30/gluconolactonase/LRE family protein [Sphingosinicella sp. CPCC 101087]